MAALPARNQWYTSFVPKFFRERRVGARDVSVSGSLGRAVRSAIRSACWEDIVPRRTTRFDAGSGGVSMYIRLGGYMMWITNHG